MLSITLRLCAAVAVLSLASAGPVSAQEAQSQPQGNTAHGKQVYNAEGCWSCHGYSGGGSAMSGPALVPMNLPFDSFKGQLRQPASAMPPYVKGVLSDRDAADIYNYLRGIPAPSLQAKDIPQLNE
jgi:mono/diheme cytochrome c family protein